MVRRRMRLMVATVTVTATATAEDVEKHALIAYQGVHLIIFYTYGILF